MPLPLRLHLRAPQDDGAALIDPPLSEVPALIAANQAIGREFDQRAGFPADYRLRARKGLLNDATARERKGPIDSKVLDAPIILSGHQPELFHPGVWFKNFVLSSIARMVSGTGVNLVIDHDTIGTASIRVPSIVGSTPQVIEIPFDNGNQSTTWENRWIDNTRLLEEFLRKVVEAIQPIAWRSGIGNDILIQRLWPFVVAEVEDWFQTMLDLGVSVDACLGTCLARGRNRLERDVGLYTYEYPLSLLADEEDFLEFVANLVQRHHDVHRVYNTVLAEYRFAAGIRGHGRPVPDLERRDDWLELPLWILEREGGERHRMFVRNSPRGCEISCGSAPIFSSKSDDTWELFGLRWFKAGFRLRPRALITTMYARLVLSDLFIHGIGGAKYDEVTDEIIRRFFGIEPPKYVTATATFRLPIDRPQVTIEDVRENMQRQREVRYRPESFVNDPLLASEPAVVRELAALAAEKREYVAKHALRRGSPEVFRGLDKLNRAMRALLAPIEQHLQREQARLAKDLQAANLLGSREFSFVLYPEEYLVPRLLELSRLPA